MRRIYCLIIALSLTACREDASTDPSWEHPEYGVVTAEHPAYKEAYEACDKAVYGAGVEISGKIYTSKTDVFLKIKTMLSADRTEEENEILLKWSGEWQPAFLQCIADKGFAFREK